jgi:hypothetical protein
MTKVSVDRDVAETMLEVLTFDQRLTADEHDQAVAALRKGLAQPTRDIPHCAAGPEHCPQCYKEAKPQVELAQELVVIARVDDLERGGRVRALAMGLALDAPLYTATPTATPAMNTNSGTTYSSLPLDRKGVIHETSEVTVRDVDVSDVVGGKTYFVSNGNGKLLEVALIVGPMNGDFYTIFIWDYMIGSWRDACYSGSLYEIEEAKLKENNA